MRKLNLLLSFILGMTLLFSGCAAKKAAAGAVMQNRDPTTIITESRIEFENLLFIDF